MLSIEGVFPSILDDRAETKWTMGLLQEFLIVEVSSPSGSDQPQGTSGSCGYTLGHV